MKIQFEPYAFEPYQVEPFKDFYIFPRKGEEFPLRELIYQDYQQDLADLQMLRVQKLRDVQIEYQQRLADRLREHSLRLQEISKR